MTSDSDDLYYLDYEHDNDIELQDTKWIFYPLWLIHLDIQAWIFYPKYLFWTCLDNIVFETWTWEGSDWRYASQKILEIQPRYDQ